MLFIVSPLHLLGLSRFILVFLAREVLWLMFVCFLMTDVIYCIIPFAFAWFVSVHFSFSGMRSSLVNVCLLPHSRCNSLHCSSTWLFCN